jgi:hypothetical protein
MAKKTLGSLIPELLVQLTTDPPHRVGILGSTSFFHPSTESICTALGHQLAQHSQVTLLTGGMPGVAEAVARNFHQSYIGVLEEPHRFTSFCPRGLNLGRLENCW